MPLPGNPPPATSADDSPTTVANTASTKTGPVPASRSSRVGRRQWLLAAAVAPWLGRAGSARANDWPSRPVRLVVAFPPGGLADVMARAIQPQLTAALKQPLLIDNRGGAAGNVAGSEVVHNGADGHTFLITVSTTESVNPTMFPKMPFDPRRDLQPAGLLANSQLFLIVRPTLGTRTLADFISYAKAHPDTLSYGSAGNGTTPHLAGELLKRHAGITATHVPYRGAAPAIQDVMAGQVDFAFAPGTVFTFAKAGKLDVLAVASRQRTRSAPEIPTFSESGIDGVFADTLFGIYAPTAMPASSVARLNGAVNDALARPDIQARFVEVGAEAIPMSPAQYRDLVDEELKTFPEIVRASGIKAD